MVFLGAIVGLAVGLGINALVVRWPARPDGRSPVGPRWLWPGVAAVAFAWLFASVAGPWALFVAAVAAAVLLLLAALDLAYRVVPNAVVFPATLAALLLGPAPSVLSAVVGALTGLAFFAALAWLGRKRYGAPALGMGDVKLAMFLGALLGATAVWQALLLGMVGAGLAAAVLLLAKRVERQSTMPYGAALALAGLVVLATTAAG